MDDFEAIRQLTARYGRASDNNDVEAWLRCFTEDGVFRRADTGRSWRGRDELADMFCSYPIVGRHVATDFLIDVTGDLAHQSCYLLFLDKERRFRLHMFGVYDDKLVRRDGLWRFTERALSAVEV
jgi:hypothetical protein